MVDRTYLEEKDLSDEEKNLVRSLYYENRLLLEDIADILGPMEAVRVHMLKDSIEKDPDEMPDPSDIGSIPDDKEFYQDRIPDDVLDEVSNDSNENE